MKLGEISQNYVTAYASFEEKLKKIQERIKTREKQLERLKAKTEKISYHERPNWIECLIKPIAEAMLPFLPDRYYKILGPFGLGARTSIHFYRDGCNDAVGDGNCISITFEPTDLNKGELSVVDQMTDLKRYAYGTIGEMNGFNHPTVPIPKDAGAKWFVDFMNQQEALSIKKWREAQIKTETT